MENETKDQCKVCGDISDKTKESVKGKILGIMLNYMDRPQPNEYRCKVYRNGSKEPFFLNIRQFKNYGKKDSDIVLCPLLRNDINGNDIYCGDILQNESLKFVVHEEEGKVFLMDTESNEAIPFYEYDVSRFRIIGSIYEL